MRWKTAASGLSWPSPARVRGDRSTDFCRAPGRSGWSRRSGPASRCDAGLSGGDNLAIAAQAGGKTLQRAVLMGRAAGDEERLDACLRRAQRVDADAVVPPDPGARQARD